MKFDAALPTRVTVGTRAPRIAAGAVPRIDWYGRELVPVVAALGQGQDRAAIAGERG